MVSYILVPGAGGDAWYWHLVASELERRGHDVVAVDLPADDDTAGLREYTDTIVRAAADRRESGTRAPRDHLVVVAQSLGGFSASMACTRMPVSSLILVNAMIPRAGETVGQWWSATGQAESMRENDVRSGRDPDAEFDLETYFFHDVPAAIRDEGMGNGRRQSEAVFASTWELPGWPDVPTRVIAATQDRFFPIDFQRRVAVERLGIVPEEIDGGHLVALSNPIELTNRLEQTLGTPR